MFLSHSTVLSEIVLCASETEQKDNEYFHNLIVITFKQRNQKTVIVLYKNVFFHLCDSLAALGLDF